MGCLGEIQDKAGNRLSTTSTPPAWHFLHECDVPVTMDELSVHSRYLPESDTFRERNDSDQCPECRCAPGHSHAKGCDGAAQLTDAQSNVVETQVESCPECGTVTDIDYGAVKDRPPDCQAHGERDGVRSAHETPRNSPVGARSEHPAWVCGDCGQDGYGKQNWVPTWHMGKCGICGRRKPVTEPRDFGNRHDAEPLVTVAESCPEDGMTDSEAAEWALREVWADGFDVPFPVQSWLFEALCEEMVAQLPHLIFTHSERIIEMARDRFRKGYAKYGSAMYSWSPERRLDEVLQELADAVVYPTSGPLA